MRYSARVVSMPTELWSETLSVRWKPTVRFLRARVEILEELEDSDRIAAFRFDDSDINVLLKGRLVELQVDASGCQLSIHTPNADRDEAQSVLELVLEKLSPSGFRRYSFSSQALMALDEDYADAIKRVGSAVLPFSGAMGLTDFAILVDGDDPIDGQLAYKIEFGVLNSEEIPNRLTRQVGRVGTRAAVPYRHEDQEYPPVALFAESWWHTKKYPDGLVSFWEYSRSRSSSLLGTLQRELVPVD